MNILITGAGSVMGQSIYQALARHDFSEQPSVHFANSDELGAGRYFTNEHLPVVAAPILPLAADINYEDYVADYIEANAIDIVYAGTQHELRRLANLKGRYPKIATLDLRVVELCMEKGRCMSFLNQHGVRAPLSQALSEYLRAPAIPGPVVVKPENSSASRRVRYYRSVDEALLSEGELRGGGDDTVQERLVGPEYTCGLYVDLISKRTSYIGMRRTLTVDGATSWAEVDHDPAIEAYVRQVGAALRRAGFGGGHINVQLIVDEKGPCLFEINGRLSSTEGPKARLGFNSSAAYLENIVNGRPYERFSVVPVGQFLRYYTEVVW